MNNFINIFLNGYLNVSPILLTKVLKKVFLDFRNSFWSNHYNSVKTINNNELAAYKGRFLENEDVVGAWKTKEKIGVDHIGLYGIV